MYSPKLKCEKTDGTLSSNISNLNTDVSEREYLAELLGFSDKSSASRNADILLLRYGSLDGIFYASREELTELIGERTALFIKIIAAINSRRVTDAVRVGRVYSLDKIIEYAVATFIGQSTESVYLLSFGEGGKFLGMDKLGEGTVNSSDIYPRRIAEATTRRRAKTAILAHNHPFGTATPSESDIISTTRLFVTALSFGVLLTHHIIVAEREFTLLEVNKETGEVTNKGKHIQDRR